jgi:hypothetical protein
MARRTKMSNTDPTTFRDPDARADEAWLFKGGLSDHWYVATKWEDRGDNHFEAVEKYDITHQVNQAIAEAVEAEQRERLQFMAVLLTELGGRLKISRSAYMEAATHGFEIDTYEEPDGGRVYSLRNPQPLKEKP